MKRGLTGIQGPDGSVSTLVTATSAFTILGLRALGLCNLSRPELGPRALDRQNLGRPTIGCDNLAADATSAIASWPHTLGRGNLTATVPPDATATTSGSSKAAGHRDHRPSQR